MNRPFLATHLAAVALGLALGLFMARYSGPLASPPDVRALITRLHVQSVKVAQADTALAFYRRRLTTRDSAIATLDSRERHAVSLSGSYAARNRALIDSLAHVKPESVTVYLARLDSGVVAQGEQCSNAISACDAAKDSLRTQIGERDSIIGTVRAQRDTSQAIATDAVAADKKLHGQLFVTRVATVVAVLGTVLILK